MNVSSTTALARELKIFEATFLSTDDPPLLWLKHQSLKYFEELITTTKVRTGGYEKSEKQKMFISS